MARRKAVSSREFVRLKIAAVKEREARAPVFLERVKSASSPSSSTPPSKNVTSGIEGRFGYEEVPSEREMPALLEEIERAARRLLARFRAHPGQEQPRVSSIITNGCRSIRHRLFGCHLHDTQWPVTDHRVPFAGGIEYDRLIPLLPENCLFVWELSPRMKAEEIRAALAAMAGEVWHRVILGKTEFWPQKAQKTQKGRGRTTGVI